MIQQRARRAGAALVAMVAVIALSAVFVPKAGASSLDPAVPYPKVTVPPRTCEAEREAVRTAEAAHERARQQYGVAIRYYNNQVDVDAALRRLNDATIAVNNARYLLAQCGNLNASVPSVCTAIGLELNRLKDEEALLESQLRAIERQRQAAEDLAINRIISGEELKAHHKKFNEDEAKVRKAIEANRGLRVLYLIVSAAFQCGNQLRPTGVTALPSEEEVVATASEEDVVEDFVGVDQFDDELVATVEGVLAPFVAAPVGGDSWDDVGDLLTSILSPDPLVAESAEAVQLDGARAASQDASSQTLDTIG